MLGAISEVDDVKLAAVEAAVGSTSFGRGRSYARANRVLKIEWDPNTATLTGSVVGQGALYDTAAFFTSDEGSLEFEDGECTCPVGHNCKHVAAIVIAATDGRGADRPRGEQRPVLGVAKTAQPRSWEQSRGSERLLCRCEQESNAPLAEVRAAGSRGRARSCADYAPERDE